MMAIALGIGFQTSARASSVVLLTFEDITKEKKSDEYRVQFYEPK